jgi:hypothetical protein
MKRFAFIGLLALSTLLFALPAFAQGVQTGIITGTVVDTSDLVLPGVTVTVTSPALQGVRSTVTDGNGVYVLRGLPPGVYDVTFELSGMRTERRTATVEVGKPAEVMATLGVEGIAETVVVTADTVASTITSTTVGANYTNKEIDVLPTGRTLQGIAALAPGLTTNTPNAGQVTISGAFAYDNVFLIDGVDVNDNLFGTANALFVEDAIEETQVLTSGISAEYGRFSGGVINAVTKSGGDIFSGSYRLNLTNDSWRDETPFEDSRNIKRPDKTNKIHEGTVGGPILRSRLWFFGSGRMLKTETQTTLPKTGAIFNGSNDEKRGELKLTGTVAQNHTFTGSYFRISRKNKRLGASWMIDPTIFENAEFPNDRWVAGYRGVLSPRLFAEVRWSQKTFGFRNTGGTSTALIDSPIWMYSEGYLYNAPYWDATDPEDRNNFQVAGSLAYFLTTPSFGSHDLKGGVEIFNSKRTGGNSQSATNYVFDADFLADATGAPIYDTNGKFIPLWIPGGALLEHWIPTRGAKVDIRTTSFFLQDSWKAGRNLSFDLGVRFEKVRGEATGDIVTVDTDTWVPRLAATYDIKGDGRFVAQATYAWYAGKYSESQFANNTDVGNPSYTYAVYTGPEGQGLNFAPAYDFNNWEIYTGGFPTANVFIADNLSSPVNKEFTASLGAQLGRGYIKATFVQRGIGNFVEDFLTRETGSTRVVRDGVDFGTFTNQVFENTDEPTRDYQALQFIGRYPILSNWTLQGNYTYQIENEGSFEGEGANTPGSPSMFGDYPEAFNATRHYPTGRLNDYQAHKLRLWTVYTQSLGFLGTTDVSLLYSYNSALTYSLTATVPLTSIQRALLDPIYPSYPDTQTAYFAERGSEEFKGYGTFDLGITYQVPIFKTLRPYVKFDVFNLFNDDTLRSWNTAISRDTTGPVDSLGIPLNYRLGAQYGKATSAGNYVVPREWTIAVGFRF